MPVFEVTEEEENLILEALNILKFKSHAFDRKKYGQIMRLLGRLDVTVESDPNALDLMIANEMRRNKRVQEWLERIKDAKLKPPSEEATDSKSRVIYRRKRT